MDSKIIDIGTASKTYLRDNTSDQNFLLGVTEDFVSNLASVRAQNYISECKGNSLLHTLKSLNENLIIEDKIGYIVSELAYHLGKLGFFKNTPNYTDVEGYWKYFSIK
jgi:hypothetical protein